MMPFDATGPINPGALVDAALRPFTDAFPPENIRHHFVAQDQAKGVYAKEILIPAGYTLVSHKHTYDHLSILASGEVLLTFGKAKGIVSGPAALVIDAGVHHTVHALTDAVWFCIHPTDETNAAAVDATLIMKDPA